MATGFKSGGRQKGSTNKVTVPLKESIVNFIEEDFEAVRDIIRKMEPRDRATFYIKLMEFVMPKNTAVDMTSGGEKIGNARFEVEIINGKK